MNLLKKYILKYSKKDIDSDNSIAKTLFNELKTVGASKNETSKRVAEVVEDERVLFKMVTDMDLDALRSIGKRNRNLLLLKDRHGKSLLHLATSNTDTSVLLYLLQAGLDIQEQDNEGNTSLHDAVSFNNPVSTLFLLSNGADSTIWNKKNFAPIHLAVELRKLEALKILLNHPSVDPNLEGDLGCTPLHFAAWKDSEECAKLLLENNAQLSVVNHIGFYPLHVAAQSSSYHTISLFIKHLEKQGNENMSEILNKFNYENNTVLHSAVVGGNLKVVEIILNAGADMNLKQDDGNTAVHMAASQGNLYMLQMMFKLRAEEKVCSLANSNNSGHTPLMEAAMLDRCYVVEYLINEGSDINIKSIDGCSALILAASKRAWGAVKLLLGQGSDATVKDKHGRNLLHLIILGEGQIHGFDFCFRKDLMNKMLNDIDQFGCTPLHYASEHGMISTIDELLKMGARINAKTNNQQSALHFACKFGRINTCRHLLSSSCSCSIINEVDSQGQTALHLAAKEGHNSIVSLLLTQGAGIFRDIDGNTPLHLAAMNGYTQTMKTLLSIHAYLINLPNRNKNTCLHLAVVEDQPNVVTFLLNMEAQMLPNREGIYPLDLGISLKIKDSCIAIINHHRWREAMEQHSEVYGCHMAGMIEMMPELCQMVLDRCRTPSDHDPKDPYFHHLYDFSFLQVEHDVARTMAEKGIHIIPLITLNMMVKHNRVECLYHPLCVAYLNNKWLSYGLWVHLTILMLYVTFLACLNIFVIQFDFDKYHNALKVPSYNSTTYHNGSQIEDQTRYMDSISMSQKVLIYIIMSFAIINIVKELLQLNTQKWDYFRDLYNFIEWLSYILLLVLTVPFVFNQCHNIQWQCGTLAVFLCWFHLLVHLQRFERFGIYVVMFLEILQTLVSVIMVFSVLIMAFGFSFYISLHGGEFSSFRSPGVSIMTSALMMLGSIDYQVWVDADTHGNLPNRVLNYIFLAFFILMMPILLINLLIGLAVGNIESVLKNAKLKRIAMQVQLHTEMELKLPLWLIKIVDKPFIRVFANPSYKNTFYRMTNASIQISASDYDVSDEMKTNVEHHSYLYRELHQQKLRTKQLMKEMEKHYELLKLLVSKMEISSELDGCDENNEKIIEVSKNESPIGWSSVALKQAILKQVCMSKK